jgi:RNase P subunit RPR2
MNPELRKQFADFIASPAGEAHVKKLQLLISLNHESAENNPELSRDYVQRAKGIREALDELIASGVEIKLKGVKKRK